MNGTGTTDADANVIDGEILLSKLPHVLVKGGREEQIAMIGIFVGVAASHDLPHLLFPVVVQHLVSFVNDGEANSRQGQNVRSRHDVNEATRSSNENIATFSQLGHLLTHGTTAIGHARTKHGAIAEATSFVKDLAAELTCRSDDEDEWLSTNRVGLSVEAVGQVGALGSKLLGLAHQLGETRDQEGGGLAGTSLSGGNDVATLENSRDGVSLNRSRVLITTELNVLEHDRVEASFGELSWSAR